MRELRPGLWHWQARHPQWQEGEPWDPNVSSYALDDSFREMEALAARWGVSLPFRFAQYGGVVPAGGGASRPVRSGLAFFARLVLGAPRSQRRRAHFWKLAYRSLSR